MSEKKSINADQKSTKTVRNSLNYDHTKTRNERRFGPSRTIPDQTMSVVEILERHARGLPIHGYKAPIYDEENDLPDPRTLDLAERQELADQYRAELSFLEERNKPKPKKDTVEKPDPQPKKDTVKKDTVEKPDPEPDPDSEPPAPKS